MKSQGGTIASFSFPFIPVIKLSRIFHFSGVEIQEANSLPGVGLDCDAMKRAERKKFLRF